jgi:hypothetical protein
MDKKKNDVDIVLSYGQEDAMDNILSWVAYIVILVAGLGLLGIGWV